jgi:putative ATP-dependent endonuclease of OLD family
VRRFLKEVRDRSDYPDVGAYDPATSDADVAALAIKVLKARKGEAYGYAAMLIAQCQTAAELPGTIREILEAVHKTLSAVPEDIAAPVPDDWEDVLG